MQRAFLKIREISIDLPDATIGIIDFEIVKTGWVVKMKDWQNFEGLEGMKKAFWIARKTTECIAGWKDGDTELWDVVAIFDNEDEATIAGKENGQMTIYQIQTGRLKWLD